MKRRDVCSIGVLAALAGLCAAPAGAADYPERPITFVVAYTPGSANDILVRLLAPALGKELGQDVVVDNKPGAGGTLGTALVARAQPDGYTLGLGSTATIAINRALYKNLSYDPLKDFTPVILFGTTPNVLVAPAASGVRSVADLQKAAAGKSLNYSSSGNGTTQHLAGVLFEKSLRPGTAAHIPFKGPAEQITAIAGGQVDFGFASLPSCLNLIRDGRLRALGVTPLAPIAALPGVPSLSTAGLAGFENTGVWFGLVVPAGTPEPVVQALHRAAARTLADNDIKLKLAAAGYEPATPAPAAEFARFVGEQVGFWEALIKQSGASVE